MKKLLSLLLALTLTLSLCAPALAAEAREPYWKQEGQASLEAYLEHSGLTQSQYQAWFATPAEQAVWAAAWTAAHPEEAAAFDPDAFFASDYSGYDGEADYMQYWELSTREEFVNDLLCTWIADQEAEVEAEAAWAALVAEQPQRTAQFLAGLDGWLKESWYPNSVEEYRRERGYAGLAQCYIDLYETWNAEYEQDLLERTEHDARIVSLGGVPGQINVMVNGRCVPFGARPPRLENGTLSVPADALQSAMGVRIKGDAEGYAPLRASAEAAGWDVQWDEAYQTAVLLDRAALTAGVDKQFTQATALFKRLLAACLPELSEGLSLRRTLTLDMDLTQFNTLDGDETYPLKLRVSTLFRDGVLSGELTADLSALAGPILNGLGASTGLGGTLGLAAFKRLLENCRAEFILDTGTEQGWVRIPMLAQATGVPEAGEWLRFDYYGGPDDLFAPQDAILSIGALVYDQAYNETAYSYGGDPTPIGFFEELDHLSGAYEALIGNGRFTEKNGVLTYTLDAASANSAVKALSANSYSYYEPNDLFRSLAFKLTLTDADRLSASADLRAGLDGYGYYGILGSGSPAGDLHLQGSLSGVPGDYTADLDLHWQNHMRLTLGFATECAETEALPLSAPPEGSIVTELYMLSDLLYAGYTE